MAKTMTHAEREERRWKMARLVSQGESPDQVAQRYGVSRSAVNIACLERGVRVGRTGRTSRRTLDVVAMLVLQPEWTTGKIAAKAGVTREWVRQIRAGLKERGVLGPQACPGSRRSSGTS